MGREDFSESVLGHGDFFSEQTWNRSELDAFRAAVDAPAVPSSCVESHATVAISPTPQQILEDSHGDKKCLGAHQDLFYEPLGRQISKKVRADLNKAAINVCRNCVLIEPCLEAELAYGISNQFGVRGGRTATERQRIIRARKTDAKKAKS